jgi:hypothetical protein
VGNRVLFGEAAMTQAQAEPQGGAGTLPGIKQEA